METAIKPVLTLLEGTDFVIEYIAQSKKGFRSSHPASTIISNKRTSLPSQTLDDLEFAKIFFPEYFAKDPTAKASFLFKESCNEGKRRKKRYFDKTVTEKQTQYSPLVAWFSKEFGLSVNDCKVKM